MTASPENRDRDLLGVSTGFLILYVIFQAQWLLYIALAVGIAAVFLPFLAKWIHQGWSALTFSLGWVNSRLILSVMFFVFLVPIAWMYRLGKKDPMFRKGKAKSYFQIRDHQFGKDEMEKPW